MDSASFHSEQEEGLGRLVMGGKKPLTTPSLLLLGYCSVRLRVTSKGAELCVNSSRERRDSLVH